ncbi:MAG TPA: 3-isopropylmalate dehydratase small subunit [Candidatus Omnitrophota bacterium]|nr:3-isopropylmalate dehydratase small subunit [Candidatus Omnitrophota bacterium]HPB67594.1 3-isopropylmalate dehydratase small subunit [Candidatus Omnitrophota bacterium]HQO59129.1 3-isopropylmalate dehydratase small subunit [Candidatus Omnitrophota bacterium]HQP12255.1 3-isopropylmalate dehydratase small subunit [Candidatus Omnitrophota bacterium]
MRPFIQHKGIAAPLDRANIDTDAIIPKQFLRKIERSGFGKHLFHEWRYTDYDGKNENPDFVLNQREYRHATVLLARDNFGCGSSREHAPWALADYGFRVIIAPSFADIFYNNCGKNGILAVRLSPENVENLFQQAQKFPGIEVAADLPKQIIIDRSGREYRFEIHPFIKYCLIKGLDQIGWTMQFDEQIAAYETRLKVQQPWLA